jgi:hypothetical protein
VNDAMVVADLTGNNANVFYELAVRHAARKPYVQIIQKGERIPFDLVGVRTIEIDHTDLDSVAEAKKEIERQMRFTAENVETIESPISVAIDFDRLRKSEDPAKRQLADVLDSLNELKVMIELRLPPDNMHAHLFPTIYYGSGNRNSPGMGGLEFGGGGKTAYVPVDAQQIRRIFGENRNTERGLAPLPDLEPLPDVNPPSD